MATEAIQPMIAALTIAGLLGVGIISIVTVRRIRAKAAAKKDEKPKV